MAPADLARLPRLALRLPRKLAMEFQQTQSGGENRTMAQNRLAAGILAPAPFGFVDFTMNEGAAITAEEDQRSRRGGRVRFVGPRESGDQPWP